MCSVGTPLGQSEESVLDMFLLNSIQLLVSDPELFDHLCGRLLACISKETERRAPSAQTPETPQSTQSTQTAQMQSDIAARLQESEAQFAREALEGHMHVQMQHVQEVKPSAEPPAGSSSVFPTSTVPLDDFFHILSHLAHRTHELRLQGLEFEYLKFLALCSPGTNILNILISKVLYIHNH